jgi:hypothetical protein
MRCLLVVALMMSAVACSSGAGGAASPSALTRAAAKAASGSASKPVAAHVPACKSAQIGASWWESDDHGGDTSFGWIAIRDRSAEPCVLRGTLHLVAVRDSGHAVGPGASDPVGGRLILASNSAPLPPGTLPRFAERAAFVLVATSDSEPDGTDCRDLTSPALIRIDLPGHVGHVDVAVRRPVATREQLFSMCRGNDLETGRVNRTA